MNSVDILLISWWVHNVLRNEGYSLTKQKITQLGLSSTNSQIPFTIPVIQFMRAPFSWLHYNLLLSSYWKESFNTRIFCGFKHFVHCNQNKKTYIMKCHLASDNEEEVKLSKESTQNIESPKARSLKLVILEHIVQDQKNTWHKSLMSPFSD